MFYFRFGLSGEGPGGQSGDRGNGPHPDRQALRPACGTARRRDPRRGATRPARPRGHPRRRGQPADRRLRDPSRRAIEQPRTHGVAALRPAPPGRVHHRRRALRIGAAGHAPHRGPDRRGRGAGGHLLRCRGNEPRAAAQQPRRGRGHAATGVVGHRPAEPVRARRPHRRASRDQPRRPGRLRAALPGPRRRRGAGAASTARSSRSTSPMPIR